MQQANQSAAVIRAILSLRADQNRMFGQPLGSQAWDLIFVLYLADAEGQRTRAHDAAFIAGIDREVGRRWIAFLKQAGVVVDCDAAVDQCITLSPDALAKLNAFVSRAQAVLGDGGLA